MADRGGIPALGGTTSRRVRPVVFDDRTTITIARSPSTAGRLVHDQVGCGISPIVRGADGLASSVTAPSARP